MTSSRSSWPRLKQAAALWTNGVGRNGKDTLCNLMGSILGLCAVTIDASTFSKIRDPNAPSPVYALCRARRFVSIREVDGSETMRLQVCKKFTDPISELSGRDLYEKIVRYNAALVRLRRATEDCHRGAHLGVHGKSIKIAFRVTDLRQRPALRRH